MDPGRNRFAGAVTLAFVALGAVGIARHEMWRDEMQAWLLAAESRSLPELFHNLRYEGHPALWHVILWAINRWAQDPAAMQVLHLAIAAAAVFLFARNAPFSRPTRALFAFSYFPFYEYSVISRSYGLGLLLVLAFCSLAGRRSRSYLPLAAVLALLANASAYAWILAAALSAALVVDVLRRADLRRAVAERSGETLLALAIYAAGAGLALVQMIPPPDGGFARPGPPFPPPPQTLLLTLSTVAFSYLPIPNVGGDLTWSSLLLWRLPLPATALLGTGLLAAFSVRLARTRTWLFLYAAGTLALFALISCVYFGWLRHHGHHVLLLIACLWLARSEEAREKGEASRREPLLILLLVLQVAAGVTLWALDLALPFSTARAAAGFVASPELAGMPIVAAPDYVGTPVSGYLGRPLLNLELGREGTFVLWNQERAKPLSREGFCAGLAEAAGRDPRGALLVSVYVPPDCRPALRYDLLRAYPRALVADERFLVFAVRRAP